jgi:hypothetical protein
MPVKLNIGLSRKVGEANFGSRGASVNLEVELDSGIVSDQQRFQERVRALYAQARQSINAELDLPSEGPAIEQPVVQRNGHASAHNGKSSHSRQEGGCATQSQVRAIFAIARRNRLDPKNLVLERFGLERPEDLSIRDASSLIDDLKRGVIGGRS